MPIISTHKQRVTVLALLCSTALSGALLSMAAPMPVRAQVPYGATGGMGEARGGDGGNAGEAGSPGTGADAGAGGSAGTAVSPNGGVGGDDTSLDLTGSGGGGGGGYSHILTGDISATSTGGSGGAGGRSFGGGGGGGGGAGGDGARNTEAAPDVHVSATVRGGNGGAGFNLGGGGGGGAGIVLENAGTLTLETGGEAIGGNGGSGVAISGGGGGAGVILNVGGNLTTAAGTSIVGGTGGSYAVGGAGLISGGAAAVNNLGEITGGAGGYAAPAGAGLDLRHGGNVLNAGTIRGGAGNDFGTGGSNAPAGGTGSGGARGYTPFTISQGWGGVGIIGADLAVLNTGTIAGGVAPSASGPAFDVRANAITFTGGDNILSLRNGSSILGNVVVESGATGKLILGDYDTLPATPAFDVSKIVNTGSADSADQFIGFTSFLKSGPNTVQLTGTGAQNWAIDQGVLAGDTNSFGGNLTFTGGVGVGRGVIFNQGFDGTYAGTIKPDDNTLAGAFTKLGAGTLTLTGAVSTGDGLATVSEGRLDVLGALASGGSTVDYTGGAPGPTATVRVAGAGATWTNSRDLVVGLAGSGVLDISGGGAVTSAQGAVGRNPGSTGTVTVTGPESSWLLSDSMLVGSDGDGKLTVAGGAKVLSSGGLFGSGLAFGPLSSGVVTVTGANSIWGNSGAIVVVGYNGRATLTATNGGTVLAGSGVAIAAASGSSGTFNIGAGAGETAAAPGNVAASQIGFGDGVGTLVFNHTGANYTFATPLLRTPFGTGTGTHRIDHLAGTTLLTGDSSTFDGITTVSGGKLLVNGQLGGTINVASGGLLGGGGTIGGNATVDGTLSAGNSPGTLTIDGDLALHGGSTSVFELNTPGVAGGTGASGNDLVKVGGNLTLGGTLDARVAAAGYYRLFNYDGALSGAFSGGTLTGVGGFTPLFANNPDVRTDVAHQVNLSVLGAGQSMLFWDGANTIADGTVNGGDGIWTTAGANWTISDGSANGSWNGSVGVFDGTAGAVTVSGTQNFDTLQFKTDGYTLSGGTLALNPASGSAGTLNIDNNVSTTIASVIADGTGTALKKVGGGTLTLAGANSYSGGTQLLGGTLSVSSDANLGAASGALTFDGGMLQVTGDTFRSTSRNIIWGVNGGGFDIADSGNAFTVSQNLDGPGALTKTGAGALRLSGANSYSGGSTVLQGVLTALTTRALGTGPVSVAGSAGSSAELRFAGSASAGSLAISVAPGAESVLTFGDSASAGSAAIAARGDIFFGDTASAGNATIDARRGLSFNGSSTAGASNITISGGGFLEFHATSSAGSATITNNHFVNFFGDNTADDATIINNVGGGVDISRLTSDGIGIGSLSGDGRVSLGAKTLTLGGLGRNDTIGGVIQDGARGSGGNLVKAGAGKLTLSGINTYTGATTVNAGTLSVNGSIASSSLTTVEAGATLGGNGTVGNALVNGGTLSPGNSVGALTVAGNLVMTAASAYMVEVSPANSDVTHVTGTATLGGATVQAQFAPGSYVEKRYTILTADGGVSGTFSGPVATNLPQNFKSALAHDGNNAYLDLVLDYTPPGPTPPDYGRGLNGNQHNVATTLVNVFNTNGGIPLAFGALDPRGLSLASGEVVTTASQAAFDAQSQFLNTLTDPLAGGYRGNASVAGSSFPLGYAAPAGEGKPQDAFAALVTKAPPMAAQSFDQRWRTFGAAYGGSTQIGGNAALGSHDATSRVYGAMGGASYALSPATELGFAFGGGGTSFALAGGMGSGRSDMFQAGVFAHHGFARNGYLSTAFAYGWHDVTTDRTAPTGERLRGDYKAGVLSGRVETGWRIDTAWAGVTPYAAAQTISYRMPSYLEQSNGMADSFALGYAGRDVTATRSELGLRLDRTTVMGDALFTLRGRAAW
ncbi:MAG: autotransporter-associated beta strand repeat-containing protein, partial [Xanthobacteraceae bacterium]